MCNVTAQIDFLLNFDLTEGDSQFPLFRSCNRRYEYTYVDQLSISYSFQ